MIVMTGLSFGDGSPNVITFDPVKIALVISALEGGGAERQFHHLAIGLSALGHDVHVFHFRPSKADISALRRGGVSLHPSFVSRNGFLRSQVKTAQTLRRLDVDVIYAFLEAPCFRASLLKPFVGGPKLVWGLRNSGVRVSDYSLKVRVLRQLLPMASPLCDLAISNSQAGASYGASLGIPATKMRVIPNGISKPPLVMDLDSARMSFRSRLGISSNDFLFGLLARNDPMKGVDILLRAMRSVLDRNPRVALAIAGTGFDHLDAPTRSMVAILGTRVHFLGRVDPWEEFFWGCDALISSSRYGEGFSNSIGEALLAGRPVICTDVGDSRAIVGKFGKIVAPERADLLADAMLAQAEHTDNRTDVDARSRWIEDHFGVPTMVRSTERELLLLLSDDGERFASND